MSIDHKLPEPVFKAEISSIEARWKAAYREDQVRQTRSAVVSRPSTRNGLVGLSCSGGGVRSAAFHLGLLQGLERHGALRHVDYLSTVSGGGYVGSTLSCLMRSGGEFPFAARDPESPFVTYIRNQANLQARFRMLDYLSMLAVLVRGILFNVLTMLPALLLLCSFLACFHGRHLRGDPPVPWISSLEGLLGTKLPFLLTPWVVLVVVSYFLASPLIVGLFHALRGYTVGEAPVLARKFYQRSFAVALLVLVAVVVFESIPDLLRWFESSQAERFLSSDLLGRAVVAVLALLGIGQVGTLLMKSRRALATTAGWLLLAAVVVLSVLAVTDSMIYGKKYDQTDVTWTLLMLPWLFGGSVVLAVGLQLASRLIPTRREPFRPGYGRLLFFLVLLAVALIGGSLMAIELLGSILTDRIWLPVALSIEIWLFAWAVVDVNFTSMLGTYRDELALSYLIKADSESSAPDGGISVEGDVALSELSGSGSVAPYHLINATLNLQGSKDPGLRLRKSDFFAFGKHFFGGPRCGYCETRSLEEVLPSLDLGTAMAISAAAVSSTRGAQTFAPAVPLLALLNVRLGYFVPNPDKLGRWMDRRQERAASGNPLRTGLRERMQWKASFWLLLQEMTGRLNERNRHLYLTDGGHIENLGVIELLRRRCKFIVAGDAEEDAEMSFQGLAALQRYARMDMGIKVELDLSSLRPGENGLSGRHCALGRVLYPPLEHGADEETGYLLYVKATLTGDESHKVQAYAMHSTAFPHEPTADQFYDEAQFEAYRELGEHSTNDLFDNRVECFADLARRIERLSRSRGL